MLSNDRVVQIQKIKEKKVYLSCNYAVLRPLQRKTENYRAVLHHSKQAWFLSFPITNAQSANVDSCASLSVVRSFLHVTGCTPDPPSHSVKISQLMRSGSLLCLVSKIFILVPRLSSNKKTVHAPVGTCLASYASICVKFQLRHCRIWKFLQICDAT